jgi:hypothetical protein
MWTLQASCVPCVQPVHDTADPSELLLVTARQRQCVQPVHDTEDPPCVVAMLRHWICRQAQGEYGGPRATSRVARVFRQLRCPRIRGRLRSWHRTPDTTAAKSIVRAGCLAAMTVVGMSSPSRVLACPGGPGLSSHVWKSSLAPAGDR